MKLKGMKLGCEAQIIEIDVYFFQSTVLNALAVAIEATGCPVRTKGYSHTTESTNHPCYLHRI